MTTKTGNASHRRTDPLMTTEELADYLNVSVATIWRWRTLDTAPPAYRLNGGSGLRYRRSAVDAWLEDHVA